MPLPEFIENEEAGPTEFEVTLRQQEIKQRLDRARKLETVDAMIARMSEMEESGV